VLLDLHAVAAGKMLGGQPARPLAVVSDSGREDDGGNEDVWIPRGLACNPAHLRPARRETLGRDPDRHPAVAEAPGTAERGRRTAPDPERRSARLRRARLDRDPLEAEEAPREARLASREELAQGEHGLVRTGAALADGHADRLEVLAALAAHADPEHDPPAREVVERRELLRDETRMAERQQDDPGADGDTFGRSGERGQGDHDIEDRVVERDVIARPDRVVADRLGELGRRPEQARVRRPLDQLAAPLKAEAQAVRRHARSATVIACRQAFS
jgi:hypothetical protein